LVDAWGKLGKHAELRKNIKLLENISSFDDDLLKQLDADLLNPKWKDELTTLFKNNPDEVNSIWKTLKEDPGYAWEISKTDPNWQKWSKREFFKEVTTKGKNFETNVCLKALKNRKSQWYNKLKNRINSDRKIDLDEYDLFSQVQLKYDGDKFFVADQVFVKYDDFGDIEDIIIIENKLRSTTNLTSPQSNALLKKSYSVRNVVEKKSLFGSSKTLNRGDDLFFKEEIKWYKIYDSDDGNVITGIDKL
jgi:hypothetical protein